MFKLHCPHTFIRVVSLTPGRLLYGPIIPQYDVLDILPEESHLSIADALTCYD